MDARTLDRRAFRRPFTASACANAATAYITNEKGNSISVIDLDKLEVADRRRGQRPRGIALSKDEAKMYVCLGDDDTIAIVDTKTLKNIGDLPSGPDPEQLRLSPDGELVFIANENDALLTAIDLATRKVVSEFPVGDRTRRRGGQPRRRDRRQYVGNDEHGPSDRLEGQENRRQHSRGRAAALRRIYP